MRTSLSWILTAALCGIPMIASAHTGGPLDASGCHADHRTGNYHCHRGEAAGYTFPNQAAMLEAVRTGVFPEKTVEAEGFFSKLWPFGKKHEQAEPAAPAPAGSATGTPSDSSAEPAAAPAPAGGVAAAPQSEAAKKLKVLQGLYEMGLITKEEYEAKRKAVLDEL